METRLTYKCNVTTDAQDSVYIDTAQGLSLVNRKLVRQGHVFKIKGMTFFSRSDQADNCHIGVSALPRTWPMFNAYKKARSLWNQMNLDAIDSLGEGNLPKYYDFKVYFDREHFTNDHLADSQDSGALETNLLPVDGDGNASTAGEWVYSKYESGASSPLEWNCHMLGTHATAAGAAEGSSGRDQPADGGSVGLVLAYQQSRGAAFTGEDISGLDQNIDVDSPWAQLFSADAQDQEVLTDLHGDNDAPPYPADYPGGLVYPEGNLVGTGYIGGGNTGRNYNRLPTFEAPLGLIKIDFNRSGASTDTNNVWITLDTEIISAC